MKAVEEALNNEQEVLRFLRQRFPVYHLSNIFFRDIHYGVRTFLGEKGMKLGYTRSEEIARRFVAKLEREKVLRPVDAQTWMVDFVEFKKPSAKPAPPAPKPAQAAAAL